MIDDPAILANILLVLFIGLFLVIVWLLVSAAARRIMASVSRDDEPEPETHGDEGGWPITDFGLLTRERNPTSSAAFADRATFKRATPAPEIGPGLLVGGERTLHAKYRPWKRAG